MVEFMDKVERGVTLDVEDTKWEGGLRFYFNNKFGCGTLINTVYATSADVLWNHEGFSRGRYAANYPRLQINANYEFEDISPSVRTVKKFYDSDPSNEEALIEALEWLREKTV